ncbi:MAG: OmpA family protein [Candidatus Azobacteroides sp.]|nr:OmpA family protein [Candidatus Azobacteroides sp.]
MKKIILSIASILIASSLFAQEEEQNQNEITINLGGGLSGLQYQMESGGKNSLGLGGSLGLGYTFFFNNQFGITTGVEANFYRSQYSNDHLIGNYRAADLQNLSDYPIEYFQLNYDYKQAYKEKQSALFVQIPLMFQFQTAGYHKFYVAAGGRVGFPVNTQFSTDASALTISGYYSKEGVTYADNLPQYGFKKDPYDAPKVDGKLSLKMAYMASLELGMKWAVNDNFKLYTGLYGDYGLNDIQQTKNAGTATYQQDYKGANPDGFLAFNNSVTSTSAIKKIVPMTVGIKFRITFGMGEKIGSAKSKAARDQAAYYEEEQRRAEAARLTEKPDTALVEVGYYYDTETGTMVKIGDKKIPDRQRPAISGQEMQILLEPIWGFDVGKWDLTPEMMKILDKKIPILKKYWYLGIVLTGNTCDLGGELLNDRLGYERAQSVKSYFMKNGLISTRFSTKSNGKDRPAVPNDSEMHRKRNRRVELSIKK